MEIVSHAFELGQYQVSIEQRCILETVTISNTNMLNASHILHKLRCTEQWLPEGQSIRSPTTSRIQRSVRYRAMTDQLRTGA